MEDRYHLLSAPELAGEHHFIRWVIHGENQSAWTRWLQTHPDRTSTLEEAKSIVRSMASLPVSSFDQSSKTELWDRIRSNISSKHSTHNRNRIFRWGLAAAATLTLLVWLSTLGNMDQVLVQNGEKEEISLPEKSLVTINAGSKVKYNKKQFTKEREINLEGEAFFKVNPGSKFSVNTPNGSVTVLGTSFNVISRPGQFEVSCYTGKVSVEQEKKETVEIIAGEKCKAEQGNDQLIKTTFDVPGAAPGWIQGKFTFENQPLSFVVDELERQFDVTVKLAPGIEDIRYSGLFESGDLEQAVNLITWPLHLKAQISGSTISISR